MRIKEIKQLRPLNGNQPWGIFWVNFEKKRLPVVVMRLILRALVLKKRASSGQAERQAWAAHDLLFISAYGEDTDRAVSFAHFVENPGNNLAELRVLGWDDDDTPLHMDYVAQMLHAKLRWDDKLAAKPDAWRKQWSDAFLIRHRHVVRTSEELATTLAALARRIRSRIRTILRSEDGFGEMRKLQRAFKAGLIHDLNDEGFADMFAQTVTYGLFSLACRRTIPGEGTAFAKDDLPHYFTSPFLKEMLGVFLGIKSRKGAIDFDELGVSDVTDLLTSPDTHMEVVLADFNNKTRGEDPVIHFYEHFLSAYNKQLKIQRGVFYTPQPAVSYIVRSAHELLQTEFGLADGLASIVTWGEMVKRNPGIKLPYNNVFVSNTFAEYKVASHDRNTIVFPLWIYSDEEETGRGLFDEKRRLNLNPAFLRALALELKLKQKDAHDLPAGLTPEDIFHYAYAVLHSLGYRNRYAEFLKIDFPRLPLTGKLELFRALSQLGGELVALHLLESPKLDMPRTEFIGGRNPEVEKASWSKNTVWLNKAQTTGFRGVPEAVWNFHIGGYQVCEKWLKDRKGRTLAKDDITHYQKIVVSLAETIRLMKEIDVVIEKHGGWPLK